VRPAPATLERRLANYRATLARQPDRSPGDRSDGGVARGSAKLAECLAAAVDGEVLRDPTGTIVRCEPATVILPIDRDRLRALPGQPPADAPLVCLDTETTGLATAAGTVAFLVGIGWWEGDRFRQAQLLLPDHPAEAALLARLADYIPPDAWLVTYNGRGFDWPLLVARYRMTGRPAPVHAGHLDLLPFVRRVFRHRLADARLRTVETGLLGAIRHGDVEGWQIPGRYIQFLHHGDPTGLVEVVRHNREDVRSLARLLGHIDSGYADASARAGAPAGDLAGLARAFAREGQLDQALACLELALDRPRVHRAAERLDPDDDVVDEAGVPWWNPGQPADFGGTSRRRFAWAVVTPGRLDSPWTPERIAVERARILRRTRRYGDAVAAWLDLATGPGAVAVHAWIEVAKLREHRLGDPAGALDATRRAADAAERRRRLGLGDPPLEVAIRARLDRLRSRRSTESPARLLAAVRP